MGNEYQIYMDYIHAIRQTEKLDELAGELDSKGGQKLQDTLDSIRRSWTGENATAFVNKASSLPSRIAGTANNLRLIASTMRRVAKNTYDTEMEALRIARDRTYGK